MLAVVYTCVSTRPACFARLSASHLIIAAERPRRDDGLNRRDTTCHESVRSAHTRRIASPAYYEALTRGSWPAQRR